MENLATFKKVANHLLHHPVVNDECIPWLKIYNLQQVIIFNNLKFQDVANFLKDKNHKINIVNPYFGVKTNVGARVQAVSVDKNGIITANNDRRKEGEVDGL